MRWLREHTGTGTIQWKTLYNQITHSTHISMAKSESKAKAKEFFTFSAIRKKKQLLFFGKIYVLTASTPHTHIYRPTKCLNKLNALTLLEKDLWQKKIIWVSRSLCLVPSVSNSLLYLFCLFLTQFHLLPTFLRFSCCWNSIRYVLFLFRLVYLFDTLCVPFFFHSFSMFFFVRRLLFTTVLYA